MYISKISTLIASMALMFGVCHAEDDCQGLDLSAIDQIEEAAELDNCCEEVAVDSDEWCEESPSDDVAVLEQDDCEEQDHVMVDSRPLSPPLHLQIDQARRCEIEQANELSDEHAMQLGALIIPIKSQNLIALASNEVQSTAAPLSPCHYHSILGIEKGNVIKISNGSEWLFDKADLHILRNWKDGQKIVITPNQEVLSSSHFTYIMNNTEVGDSIKVNLFLGPSAFGTFTSWIVGIDQNLGKIYMINGRGERTVWEVASSDMYLVKDWKVNDTIILGENDSWLWFFSSYNSMMINVNMNHYVRSKQIFQANHR